MLRVVNGAILAERIPDFLIGGQRPPVGNAHLVGGQDEVVFDGERLIWPWGESETELIQIKAQARWLYAWIQQATGLTIPIRPILAIPGWSVLEREVNSIRVLPPKLLPPTVLSHSSRQLSDDQIDLIARQLEQRCRDIID